MTSWPQQFADIDFFLSHVLKLYSNAPVYLYGTCLISQRRRQTAESGPGTGHSMGGALVLAYCTRTPAYENVNRLAGVISSSPLLRQAKDVRAPAWMVRAGSLVGKLSGTMPIKATVKPEVRAPLFWHASESFCTDRSPTVWVREPTAHLSRPGHPEGVRERPALQAGRHLPWCR